MSRLRMCEDTVAQVCIKYIHGELDESMNQKIWKAIHDVVKHEQTIHFAFEIAYRIGYARSYLADAMSEVTYKIKKKAIRDKIAKLIEKEQI